jgi:hypothetical protein
MREQTSSQLIDELNNSDKELRRRIQMFAEIARDDSVQLPICCFFETKKTEMLRQLLSPSLATKFSAAFNHKTHKIVCYPSRHT